jgi:predicted dehydrogenase
MRGEQFGGLSSITLMHGSGPYDEPRRMLLFNGIHLIDLARFLGGDIEQVHAFRADGRVLAQAVCASFRFRCGAVGQLNMNSGHTWDDCFELVYVSGQEAGLLLDASKGVEVMTPAARFAEGEGQRLFGWSSRYYVSGNMAGWHAGGHYTRGYWGELSHFARAVLGQVEPRATLEDGVAAMELIEAILRSSQEGGVVGVRE